MRRASRGDGRAGEDKRRADRGLWNGRALGFRPAFDSPTNQQFFTLPNALIDRLRTVASFENWGVRGAEATTVRFVTSWATTDEDIKLLLSNLN